MGTRARRAPAPSPASARRSRRRRRPSTRPGSCARSLRMRIASAPARSPRRMRRRARWSAARTAGPARSASTRRNSAAAASSCPSFSSVAPTLKRTRAKKASVPGASSFFPRARRGWRGCVSRMDRNAVSGLRESAARREDPAEVEAGAPARDVVARASGARVAFRREALGEVEVALRLRGLDEERKQPVGQVSARPGRASRARGRSRPRRRAAPRGGSPRGATPRPTSSPDWSSASARSARRRRLSRGAAGGRAATRRARVAGVEARLERVERDAERAPRDGASLPLQQRKEQLERAGSVAAFEPERAGGEAGRHVEEVVGGDVALEERDRLVAAARRGERARGEVVEAAVGVPLGGLSLQAVEPLQDLRPSSGARGGREIALARPGSRRAPFRRRGGERGGRGRRSGGRLSAGRPREGPSAEEMEVQVEDALARFGAVVDDDAVAVEGERAARSG